MKLVRYGRAGAEKLKRAHRPHAIRGRRGRRAGEAQRLVGARALDKGEALGARELGRDFVRQPLLDVEHRVVEHLQAQGGPQYLEGILDAPGGDNGDDSGGLDAGEMEADPMYDQAVALVLKTRRPSISLVQRHLRIGYNRAARLIEQMERAGLVSAMQTNGNREVLVPAGKE